MNRFRRVLSLRLPVHALAMMVGALPLHASNPADSLFSRGELEVLDEYRLHCRPGRFIEDVKANLDTLRQRYPGSDLLQDSAFLADVHYLDRGHLRDGNGHKAPEWVHFGMFDSLFNGYAPSREAWGKARRHDLQSTGYAGLGVVLLVTNAFLGLHALANPASPREPRPKSYRLAQLALPAGWIGSFVYAGICSKRGDRELDRAFFERNGKAVAKKLGSR